MDQVRTFSKIVLALHMPESEVTRFVRRLGLPPESVPRHKTTWKHVAKPNINKLLTFGRQGLKHVKADRLVNQIIELGYRYRGCLIAGKLNTVTKTDVRRVWKAERTILKEGDTRFDESGQPTWKLCLTITFELTPSLPLEPETALLSAILQPLIWRRGRAFALWDKDGVRSSLIELVGPTRSQPRSSTRLIFRPPGIFEDHPVCPP